MINARLREWLLDHAELLVGAALLFVAVFCAVMAGREGAHTCVVSGFALDDGKWHAIVIDCPAPGAADGGAP